MASTTNDSENDSVKPRKRRPAGNYNVKTEIYDEDSEVEADRTNDDEEREPQTSKRLPPLRTTNQKKKKKKKVTSPISEDANSEATVTRPKRRKKAKAGSQEALVNGAGSPDSSVPKRRKRKMVKTEPEVPVLTGIGLTSELYDLSEDVVDTSVTGWNVDDTKFTGVAAMQSEPDTKLYIEKKSGFKAADKVKVFQQRNETEQRKREMEAICLQKQSMTEFALSTHRVFKTISVFLQGLFAGLVLWQIITTYLLLYGGVTNFLENYYLLASPVQCVYYFLFAICTVAALDRYDLANPTRRLFIESVTLQAGTVCILFYFIGLVFSLADSFLDERISLYKRNQEVWNATLVSSDQMNLYIYQWQVLNIIRGIMVILGWFIISLRPGTDRLTKSLLKANENVLGLENQAANKSLGV